MEAVTFFNPGWTLEIVSLVLSLSHVYFSRQAKTMVIYENFALTDGNKYLVYLLYKLGGVL